MSEDTWRPLEVEADDDVAEYDALHEGVPQWMWSAYWAWVQDEITVYRRYSDGSGSVLMLNSELAEQMCQSLRIPLPNLRKSSITGEAGRWQLSSAITALTKHPKPLQIADYLLAHSGPAKSTDLDALLTRSKSAWTVGTRAGHPGLVRRVPLGVQMAADSVMARSGRAGTRLATAWEELYGVEANASTAYGLAIKAVEDAAIPVVSPTNTKATLGTVLAQMEQQGDWRLPMQREHDSAPASDILAGMMRLLWHGQHDRHGGQPSAPGDVSVKEATIAVSLAVTLVNLLSTGVVARSPQQTPATHNP